MDVLDCLKQKQNKITVINDLNCIISFTSTTQVLRPSINNVITLLSALKFVYLSAQRMKFRSDVF